MQVELNNRTQKLAVIGDPVLHSMSPLIQNTMISALGLNYVYLCQTVKQEDTAAWLSAAKLTGYAGFNATMPHKVNLVPLMEELDADAALYQAVNTVCIRDGRAYGHNTDGRGFLQSLLDCGVNPEGRRITILGTGGAAKSVALKLVQVGAEHLTVCNRTLSKAEALCSLHPDRMTASGFSDRELNAAAEQCELLVNCTSLGMTGVPAQFEMLSFVDALKPETPVYDVIYSPAQTALLKAAAERGHVTSNGLGMLVWQAVFALEHFTDTKIDGIAMQKVLSKVLPH